LWLLNLVFKKFIKNLIYKNNNMFKKIFVTCLSLGIIFSTNASALALTFQKIEPVTDTYDLKLVPITDKLLLPILPTEEETLPDRVIATSTVIDVAEEEEEEVEEPVGLNIDLNIGVTQDAVIDKTYEEEESVVEKAEPITESSENTQPDVSERISLPVIEKTSEKPKSIIAEMEVEKAEMVEAKPEALLDIDFSKIDVGAVLDVCNIGPSCSGDVGKTHWNKESGVRPDDKKRGLRFGASLEGIKNGILQASYFSFEENENPPIIYTQGIPTGESVFDFNILLDTPEVQTNLSAQLSQQLSIVVPELKTDMAINKTEKSFWSRTFEKIKNIFYAPIKWAKNLIWKSNIEVVKNEPNLVSNIKITHNTYYLRVIPTINGKVVGKASNQIKVTLAPPQEGVEFFSPAKLYEVKIKDFQPIRGPEPGVCTGAMILDTDWVAFGVGGQQVLKKAGERICPNTYQGIGEEAWYESLWNTVKSGVDWVSAAYNALKSAVVDGLAGIACGGNDVCRMAISAGLDIGLAAMGVPPSIPNFDELVDGGFDYLASEIASQAGCPDAVCKEAIKEKLKEVLDENKNTNPGCKGEEEAHSMGIEPLCLPANVKAHLDPLGTHRSASVMLEVKRNYLDGSSVMGAPYRLLFNNLGYNAGPVGSKIVNIEPYGESVEITEPLQNQVFESKNIVIPELEKGQTINIPIVFMPVEYWVPGHLEAMHGWSTVTYADNWFHRQYDDWWKLYYGGTMTMSAVIDGCEYSNGDSSCIVSSDSMTVSLPNTLNP